MGKVFTTSKQCGWRFSCLREKKSFLFVFLWGEGKLSREASWRSLDLLLSDGFWPLSYSIIMLRYFRTTYVDAMIRMRRKKIKMKTQSEALRQWEKYGNTSTQWGWIEIRFALLRARGKETRNLEEWMAREKISV